MPLNPGTPADILSALLADQSWSVSLRVVDNPAANVTVRAPGASPRRRTSGFVLAQRPGLEDEVTALLLADPSVDVHEVLPSWPTARPRLTPC